MDRLADLRQEPQTMQEAIGLFNLIAQRTIMRAALDAAFEKRVAKIKAEHEANTAALSAGIADDGLILAQFIESHQDAFQKPRKVQTSFGSFGLQTVSELLMTDPQKVEDNVVEACYEDCFERIIKLIKPAIKKRIEAGEKIPGARIVSGDTAVFKVEKSLIDQARAETE